MFYCNIWIYSTNVRTRASSAISNLIYFVTDWLWSFQYPQNFMPEASTIWTPVRVQTLNILQFSVF